MGDFNNALSGVISDLSSKAAYISRADEHYIDSDGLKRCKVCNERHETYISIDSQIMKVPCVCSCGRKRKQEELEEYRRLEKEAELPKRQAECFGTLEMTKLTFDADDSPKSTNSSIVRIWVNNYGPDAKWLFLYGGFGTGKTFYAACIANEMLKRGYTVKMVGGADIEADIFAADDKASVYAKYARYDILIIDDFAAERKSDYMYEIINKIINDRYNAKKTMVFTSNMTKAEAWEPQDPRVGRIMSRIWQYGILRAFVGADRRKSK